jgi:hypothetical protein
VDPAGELLQFRHRVGQFRRDAGQPGPLVAPAGRNIGLRGARCQPDRDQPLLGAVVQIALDPPASLVRRGDRTAEARLPTRRSSRPTDGLRQRSGSRPSRRYPGGGRLPRRSRWPTTSPSRRYGRKIRCGRPPPKPFPAGTPIASRPGVRGSSRRRRRRLPGRRARI